MIQTIITISRPDVTIPFFYNIDEFVNSLEYSSEIANGISSGLIITEQNSISSDNLEFKRVITWNDENSMKTFLKVFNDKYPEFINNRLNYCKVNGHQITIEIVNI